MRKVVSFLVLAIFALFSTNVAYADTGWVKDGEVTYYYKNDGTKATGFQTIDNKKYYFYSTGGMAKGWLSLPGDRKFYFLEDGSAATGFKTIDGMKYYFYSTGGLVKGWLDLPGGRKFYFQGDGTAAKGFQNVDGKKRYFYSTGGLATGWLSLPGDRKFFLQGDGSVSTGFQTIEGKTYYFYSTGGMARGELILPGDRIYCFNSETGVLEQGLQLSATAQSVQDVLTCGYTAEDGTGSVLIKRAGVMIASVSHSSVYLASTSDADIEEAVKGAGALGGNTTNIREAIYLVMKSPTGLANVQDVQAIDNGSEIVVTW